MCELERLEHPLVSEEDERSLVSEEDVRGLKEEAEEERSSLKKSSISAVGEILEGKPKRTKKTIERFQSHAPKPKEKLKIEDGRGDKLGDIPRTNYLIGQMSPAELKPLHSILFDRPGQMATMRRNMRLFNGFPFEVDSESYIKKKAKLLKNPAYKSSKLRRVCYVLDLEQRGNQSDLIDRILMFLTAPKNSGKVYELYDSEMAPLSPSEDTLLDEDYTHVDHIDYTLDEIKYEIENPYQTNVHEKTDEASSGDTERSLADGGERPSDVHEDEEDDVEEQNDNSGHSDSESDFCPDDAASDSGSHSSSGSSSGVSSILKYNNPPSTTMCTKCGRGPFRNVKVHLLHCQGASRISLKEMFRCSVCNGKFATKEFLRKHQMCLYSCDICGQVFSQWHGYRYHPCHNYHSGRPTAQATQVFCSESMPRTCQICKAFFSNEKSLSNHLIKAHNSLGITKVCTTTKPSDSTDTNVSQGMSTTVGRLSTSGSGHAPVSNHSVTGQSPRVVNLIMKGKLSADHDYAGPLPAVVQSSPSSASLSSGRPGLLPPTSKQLNGGFTKLVILKQKPTTFSQAVLQKSATNPQVTVTTQKTHSQPPIIVSSQKMTTSNQSLLNKQSPASPSLVRPLPNRLMSAPNTAVRSGINSGLSQGTNQPPGQRRTWASVPVSATNRTPGSVASHPVSPVTPPLNILALFQNNSREVALLKRKNAGWRSKSPYPPCRQCGAVSRQPSLIISHRYLHRGRRLHRCQCGRAFKHRLHLLRHCMQHAEATSFICVSCGRTFTGAKLFAEHIQGNSSKSSKSLSSECSRKHRGRRKCTTPFSCNCGQLFFRPSAYIWHQLKNKTKAKSWKKPSK